MTAVPRITLTSGNKVSLWGEPLLSCLTAGCSIDDVEFCRPLIRGCLRRYSQLTIS